jgi:SAM-dependent methyltransferase
MGKKLFYNPTQHPEWIPPHSQEWYDRLASEHGEYAYPWNSVFDETTAETIFGQKLSSYITNKSRVLDVGCGHGHFLLRWASNANEGVGIDIQEKFISTAKSAEKADSFSFLTINVNDGLPFADDYFDVVYSKKGPWLFNDRNPEGNRIIKRGGNVLQLMHGFTDGGLRALFPGLFYVPTSPWDKTKAIQRVSEELQLSTSQLTDTDIQVIEEVEYLISPEDVLLKKCFGQSKKLKDYVWKECLDDVKKIFNVNATNKGLRVINYYFLISARA